MHAHAALIDGRDAFEVLERLFCRIRRRHLDAGIVECHVESAVFGDSPVHHCRYLRFIGDVASNADCDAILVDDLSRLPGGEIAVDVGEYD